MNRFRAISIGLALFALILPCWSDTPPAAPSISDLEKQIKDTVGKTDSKAADKAAIRNLNSLKIQLIGALNTEVQQSQSDITAGKLSSSAQRLLNQGITADQSEIDSLNDSLGSWATGLTAASPGGTPPTTPTAAPVTATPACPLVPYNPNLAKPALSATAHGDNPTVSGTVKPDKNVTTTVQVCADSALWGPPGNVDTTKNPPFSVSGGGKLTPGQKLVAQVIEVDSAGTKSYGAPSDVIFVDSCKMAASGSDKPPTLQVSIKDETKGVATFSGTAPGADQSKTIVRICITSDPRLDAIPLLDSNGKEVTTPIKDANGNFDSSSTTFKVNLGDQIVAQTESTGTPKTYGQLSDVEQISSLGMQAGSPPSNGFVANIVAGVEQTGYSSLGSNTDGFISAFFRNPYTSFSPKSPLGIAAWGRVRILGAPQPGVLGISSILTNPTGTTATQSFSSIGTAFDYVVGPELKLNERKIGTAKARISLIAGAGATTPLSTNSVTVSYAVPPPLSSQCQQLIQLYGANNKFGNNPYLFPNPNPANSCIYNPQTGQPYSYISFVNENRSNFLFKWGVGGRLTHIYPAKDKTPSYTGSLDVTVGQDSSITGGKVSGWVFNLNGVYPIPFTGSLLYVFGTAAMRFQHNYDYPLLPLTAATGVPTPPSQQVAILSQQQPNRDFYRLGFGLNLGTIWCKFSTAGCPSGSDQAGSSNQSNNSTPGNSNATPTTTGQTTPAPAGGKKQ